MALRFYDADLVCRVALPQSESELLISEMRDASLLLTDKHALLMPRPEGLIVIGLGKIVNFGHQLLARALLDSLLPRTALILCGQNTSSIFDALKSITYDDRQSTIEKLIRSGIGLTQDIHLPLKLSGGSYASVHLDLQDVQGVERWVVVKEVKRPAKSDQDVDIRLEEELRFIGELPHDVKDHFPEIIDYDIRLDNIKYRMRYYPYPTLAELLFSQFIDEERAYDILTRILEFLFDRVYTKYIVSPDPIYVKSVHLARIRNRMDIVLHHEEGSAFRSLVSCDTIILNGTKFTNLFPLLSMIDRDAKLLHLLSPPFSSLSHGDLVFEDILVHLIDDTGFDNFVLIDPRGKSYDMFYDLAKLLLSSMVKYDFYYFDAYNIDYKYQSGKLLANIILKRPEIQDIYQSININVLYLLERKLFKNQDDPFWPLRLLFMTGFHCLSLPKFHLLHHQKLDRAIAFYLLGVELLNKAMNLYTERWCAGKMVGVSELY